MERPSLSVSFRSGQLYESRKEIIQINFVCLFCSLPESKPENLFISPFAVQAVLKCTVLGNVNTL